MIIDPDGYLIEQYPKKNMVILRLPQTDGTVISTVVPCGKRKLKLTDTELSAIMYFAKAIYTDTLTKEG